MSLTGSVKVSVSATLSVARDLGSASVTESLAELLSIADGSAANQATQAFGDRRTLTAAASEELDLSGTLTNGLGATVNLTRVVLLAIKAAATNGGTLTIGASANAWEPWAGAAGDTLKVRPGGLLLLTAPDATGYPVTVGTADLLKITNDDSGAGADYDILLIGSEA